MSFLFPLASPMAQNLYDKACRYLVMLDPVGFLGWLLNLNTSEFAFQGWLDTRAIVYPGESDRTSDLVAQLSDPQEGGRPWAIILEFQITPDYDMFGRSLGHIASVWRHVRPDLERVGRFSVGAAIVNLTGRGNCSHLMQWPKAGLTTNLIPIERNLEFESAEDLLKGVEAGRWPRLLLAFVPLMIGGSELSIIDQWVALARAEPDSRHRDDYAGIALIFANRVGCKPIWEEKLKGWNMNMTESALLDELFAKREGKIRAECEALGRIQEAQSMILRFGAKLLGSASSSVETALRDIHDRERLERIGDRIMDASDWNDLLATP
jgi:hypothetical protein